MAKGRPPANRRETELSFHTVAQAAPTILWTADADGSVDFLSHQLYDYSGVPQDEGLDWGWKQALHPDDVGACMER
jgi:PAS domain-containing protein